MHVFDETFKVKNQTHGDKDILLLYGGVGGFHYFLPAKIELYVDQVGHLLPLSPGIKGMYHHRHPAVIFLFDCRHSIWSDMKSPSVFNFNFLNGLGY